jgi:hypothetical protein
VLTQTDKKHCTILQSATQRRVVMATNKGYGELLQALFLLNETLVEIACKMDVNRRGLECLEPLLDRTENCSAFCVRRAYSGSVLIASRLALRGSL